MKDLVLTKAQNNFDFFETPEHYSKFIYDNSVSDNKLKILDVCCGLGSLSKMFYENGHDITMIELNNDFLPYLKENYPNANIIHDDFLKMKIKNDFDIIVCNPPFNTTTIKKIYKLFFVKILELINFNTKVYFICPNMFIKNQLKIKTNINYDNRPTEYLNFVKDNKMHPAIYYLNTYGFIQLDSYDFTFDKQCLKKMKLLDINNNEDILEVENNEFMIRETFDIRFLKDITDFKFTKTHCILLRISH